MRLLILDNAPFLGGAQVNLRHLARLLRERGCAISLALATSCDPVALSQYQQLGLQIDFVPMGKSSSGKRDLSPMHAISAIRALNAVAKRRRVEVIFASSQRAGALAATLTALGLARSVWRLCDMGVPMTRKAMTMFVNRATCVSDAVYRNYRALPRGHFRLVQTGVWAPGTDLATVARRRRDIRATLGIPHDALVVGSVCNLQYWKGFHVVLAAFRLVLAEVPNAFLVHLGGPVSAYPSYPSRIEEMIDRWGLRDRVRILGHVIDPLPYYSAFDVFAHLPVPEPGSPEPEAFGQVAAEAMAYRVPVVASQLGGLPEVVHKPFGVLVAPGSAEEAAHEMVALLRDDGLRLAMAEQAFERYQERFTIEREADDYMRIFKELV